MQCHEQWYKVKSLIVIGMLSMIIYDIVHFLIILQSRFAIADMHQTVISVFWA